MAAIEERPPWLPAPRREPPVEPWVIVAQDGADDDGGTLYTLLDEHGTALVCAAWPDPLEERALLAGRATVRGPSWTGSTTEIAEFKRRRTRVEHDPLDVSDAEFDRLADEGRREVEAELEAGGLDTALVAVVVPDRCKVEGCTNRYVQRLGPYGRLCAGHANERKEAVKDRSAFATPEPELAAAGLIEPIDLPELFEKLLEVRAVVKQAEREIERGRAELAELLEELGKVVTA